MPDSKDIAPETALRDKISDRIKGSFVELVGEEQWAALVEQGIRRFTQPIRQHGRDEPSPLDRLIEKEIELRALEIVREEIAAMRADPKTLETLVRRIMEQHMARVMTGAMLQPINNALMAVEQGINERFARGY